MQQQDTRPWYEITNIAEVDSPALVVYADRVQQNIRAAIELTGDVGRLRPHAKTHKSPDVTRLMLQEGITKFKCATIAEAEMLASCGASDVLLAYQLAGPKVLRFLEIQQHYPATKFSSLVDNVQTAEELNHHAANREHSLSVFIDLNVGMNRTGIVPDKKAIELAIHIAGLPNLVLKGLHVYDGHITDPDLTRRTRAANEAITRAMQLKENLTDVGIQELTLIAGGSPTFPIHAERPDVECSPGTFVFWDAGYSEAYPEQPFLPAALVISRVISVLGDRICVDLGHKSVAAENPLPRRVKFVNAPNFTFVGQSEEHLVLRADSNFSFAVGDVLYGMPIHICPTCNLYERAFVVENGEVVGEWKITARDRKINF